MNIYGGLTQHGKDDFTGNTINIKTKLGKIKSISNFQYYNFYLPKGIIANDIMVEVDEKVDLNNTNVKVTGVHSDVNLFNGFEVTLIDAQKGLENIHTAKLATFQKAATVKYEGKIYSEDNKSLNFKIDNEVPDPKPDPDPEPDPTPDPEPNPTPAGKVVPGAKILSEGHLASLVFINSNRDLLSSHIRAIVTEDLKKENNVFARLNGGKSKYESGSHVDVSGVSFIAGYDRQLEFQNHSYLNYGLFAEGGMGNYDAYYTQDNINYTADGKVKNYGLGLFGVYVLNNNLYFNAELKGGRIINDLKNSDLTSVTGQSAEYNSKTYYFGSRLGLGYIFNISDEAKLDFSSTYLFLRQGKEDITTTTGDELSFKATNSNRWQNKFLFVYEINEYLDILTGLGHEYEFSGKANATTFGYDIEAPSIKGHTGIGEFGITYNASSNLKLDLKAKGFTGKRRGATGNLGIKYSF